MVSYAAEVHWRSWLARLHDTQEVTGSSPVWTIPQDARKLASEDYLLFAEAPVANNDKKVGDVDYSISVNIFRTS